MTRLPSSSQSPPHDAELAQQDRAAAVDRDLVDLLAVPKRHPLPVAGEERVHGALGASQFGGVRLIQPSREQLWRPTGDGAHIHQSRSIGRDHDAAEGRDGERHQ